MLFKVQLVIKYHTKNFDKIVWHSIKQLSLLCVYCISTVRFSFFFFFCRQSGRTSFITCSVSCSLFLSFLSSRAVRSLLWWFISNYVPRYLIYVVFNRNYFEVITAVDSEYGTEQAQNRFLCLCFVCDCNYKFIHQVPLVRRRRIKGPSIRAAIILSRSVEASHCPF